MSAPAFQPAARPTATRPVVPTPTFTSSPMRLLRLAAVALTTLAATPVRAAGAQTDLLDFEAAPTAGAAGPFLAAGGYTFTNFSSLETGSSFGTGTNGAGQRFAYVRLGLGFGSVRRESRDFYLRSALLSFRAFDGNAAGPLTVTINGYRGLDPAADPIFTQTVQLTNATALVALNSPGITEFEILTDDLEAGGRLAAVAVDDLTLASVPEPTTVLLFGAGAVTLAAAARRRRAS